MGRDDARTIKVRCATWAQVSTFLAEKLRADTLVIKMPVQPVVGDGVTLALGLPNGLVFAIDGQVAKIGARDAGGKFPVAMRMHGMSREVRERLKRLIDDGQAGLLSGMGELPGPAEEASAASAVGGDREPGEAERPVEEGELLTAAAEPRLEECDPAEQAVFRQLDGVRRQHRELAAHELLGLQPDANPVAQRAAYLQLAKRYHPDVFGRYRSPAVRRLAEEIFLHVNRAYDRLRAAAQASGAGSLVGPARSSGSGWMTSAHEVTTEGAPAATAQAAPVPGSAPVPLPRASVPPATAAAGPAVAPRVATPPAGVPVHARAPSTPTPLPAPRASTPPAPAPPQQPLAARVATPPAGVPVPTATPPVGVGRYPAAEAPPEPDDVPFDSTRAARPLTAEALFGDMELGAEDRGGTASSPVVSDGLGAGRAALEASRWDEARALFAAALRVDPRNREARALYHVASGHELKARGQASEAILQFETALVHDRQCAEALRALGRGGRTTRS